MQCRAEIVPTSFNKEAKTVDVVWSTGAEVRRGGFFEDDFLESLSMEAGAVRMGRLQSGAPVLEAHHSYGLSGVLGVVESASIDGQRGVAKLRFSDRPEVQAIVRDIENKIIRNISVGYVVHKYKNITTDSDKVKRLRAVDWEPYEISVVAIPADSGAQFRADGATGNPDGTTTEPEKFPVFIEEMEKMTSEIEGVCKKMSDAIIAEKKDTPTEPAAPEASQKPQDTEQIRHLAIMQERGRVSEINALVRKANLEQDFADGLVRDGLNLDQVRGKILDAMIERSKKTSVTNNVRVEMGGLDETVTRREAVENSLLSRFDQKKYVLTEAGRKYRSFSLLELSRKVLEWRGVNTDGFGRSELAGRAMHSTSDFPLLLANVATKTLRDGYAAVPQTFLPFCKFVSAVDFKPMYRVALGDAPKLAKVNEAGEFKYGTMKESGENYKIDTWGKIMSLTRKTIINDDLNAFTKIPTAYGVQAANLESDLFWTIITDNAVMGGDSTALFDTATHGNLAGSGAVISITTLTAARLGIRTRKGIDGVTQIQLTPTHLVVPCALETIAEQYVANNTILKPVQASNVNPFAGKLTVVSENRLDDVSAIAWYVFCTTDQTDMVEIATLDGQRGPTIETELGFEIDGVKIKAAYDIGAAPIDYRGMYKNPGA
jgi:phage major head subunit gpT-like protein